MKKLAISFLLTGAVCWISGEALAQTKTKGEVTDQEFVIRKDRVLTVPTQPRIYEKLPVLPQPKGLSDFTYPITPINLSLPRLTLEATPLQKNYAPPRLDLYPGFVRAGYGNFASPLLEMRYMATKVADFNYALQLNHQSFGKGPVKAEQSADSHTNFGTDASYFGGLFEVYGGLKWNQDKYSFYGVNPSVFEDPTYETSDNVLNTIQFKAGIREIEKTGPFTYEGELSIRSFNDSYMVTENEIGIKAAAKFRPSDDWTGKVGISYFTTNPEDLFYSVNRNYFAIRPEVSYQYDAFRFSAGLNIVSENDSIADKSSDFRIFPVLKASYQFAEEFGFYGEFSGDVNRNTYFSFVRENPFLGPSRQLLNTVNNYKIKGGIEGQFQESFHYNAGIDVSRYNQMHFFVNSGSDSSRFEVVYDDKSTVFNINAELGFRISEMYTLGSRLDLYQYDLNLQQEAWHRPTWEVRVNNQIKPVEQLLIQANVNFMGGLKARGMPISPDLGSIGGIMVDQVFEVENLKTIADLQLKADYKITDRISVFAEGNNILNGKNTRWLNYPVRGIQLIGGASFKF